jgi:hypothetical protein
VTTSSDPLPADLAAAHAIILAQREQLILAKSEAFVGRLEIERLMLMLAKARDFVSLRAGIKCRPVGEWALYSLFFFLVILGS